MTFRTSETAFLCLSTRTHRFLAWISFGGQVKNASSLRRHCERVSQRFARFLEPVSTECFTAIPIWLALLAEGVIKYLIFRTVEGVTWNIVFCPADQGVGFSGIEK